MVNKSKGNIFDLVLRKSNRDGLVAVYLVCTKPSSMGDCILNSNTDKLKGAMNHRVEQGENCFF